MTGKLACSRFTVNKIIHAIKERGKNKKKVDEKRGREVSGKRGEWMEEKGQGRREGGGKGREGVGMFGNNGRVKGKGREKKGSRRGRRVGLGNEEWKGKREGEQSVCSISGSASHVNKLRIWWG